MDRNDEALGLLKKANAVTNSPAIQKEISALNEITTMAPQAKSFTLAKDQNDLLELAMDYYTLREFNNCIGVFKDILTFDNQDPQMFSNIASMYALAGNKTDAITYYNKALQLDPTLPGAVNGKNQVESGE